MKLEGFANADLTWDVNNRKNTVGYVYTFKGIVVSWVSQL